MTNGRQESVVFVSEKEQTVLTPLPPPSGRNEIIIYGVIVTVTQKPILTSKVVQQFDHKLLQWQEGRSNLPHCSQQRTFFNSATAVC